VTPQKAKLSDIQLKRLEAAAHRRTSRTARAKPPAGLLGGQRVYAVLAEPADALGAGVALGEQRQLAAAGAVDVDLSAGVVGRRGVREPRRRHVERLAGR